MMPTELEKLRQRNAEMEMAIQEFIKVDDEGAFDRPEWFDRLNTAIQRLRDAVGVGH